MKDSILTIRYIIALLIAISFTACDDDDYSLGDITEPSNLQVEVEIIGADADNPYGDGSGMAEVYLSAENALNYRIITETGAEILAPNGYATINFSDLGVNVYNLTAVAYGAGGMSTSTQFSVEILATYQAPTDLLDKLFGPDGSRTWRIKAEEQGHFGLGPVNGNVPTEWYGAAPYDKEDVGMYDDRYIFNEDGTFTHITNGTVFGRVGLIDEIGTGGEVDGADVYNLPYEDYSADLTLIAPGGVETIVLSGNAFIGYYTGGNHQYRIFDRSAPNEITLSTTDGNGEFEWWFVLTTEEVPVE